MRKVEEGREVRTVEIDPERAPLVAWAFRAYASGQWTIRNLLDEVTRRGLLSKPTPKRPSQPIVISAFHEMLKNPYYIGIVRYRGIEYQGKHEPLIDRQTFDTVQKAPSRAQLRRREAAKPSPLPQGLDLLWQGDWSRRGVPIEADRHQRQEPLRSNLSVTSSASVARRRGTAAPRRLF